MTYTINVIVTSASKPASALLMVNDVAGGTIDVEDCRAEYQRAGEWRSKDISRGVAEGAEKG
jgi:hypothetical protein